MKTCSKCASELDESEFYDGRANCKACHRADVAARKAADPAATKAAAEAYRLSEKGKATRARLSLMRSRTPEFRARVRAWDATPAGQESQRRRRAKWEASPKGRAARLRIKARRRSALADVESTLTAEEWAELLTEHGGACAYCGRPFTDSQPATQDHVIPISKGGHHIKANVVPACRPCNSSKKDRTSWEPKSSSTPAQSPPTSPSSSSH